MGAGGIGGLALAGGRSLRFGREKAAAILAGRPLLAWSLAALDARCEAVAVSASPGSEAEAMARVSRRAVLHDDPAGARDPWRASRRASHGRRRVMTSWPACLATPPWSARSKSTC
ncbi:MAG: NTP transferase domain-containing protein [Caulobacteraceae bacterium]|nr:NTP transferase domain-containing protein [Caulobacteraceae bacterium]